MAGKNNFYPYGESSTNILNNSEYQTDQERTAGAARGAIARSRIYNKALRQSAAGAYAVADLVAAAGKDADDASAATLAENFRAAISYQARAFVASAVSISGGLATATVDELATTAKDDLPALFSLAMVLDQSLPAGSSIKIVSSLPDTDLTFPIYSGGEALEADTITAGAITLLIDTTGGKAFFKAGGGVNDTLPAQVTNFKAVQVSGAQRVTVSWTNPTSYFSGILIMRKAGSAPTGVRDGTQVYKGTGTSFTDSAVSYGATYYYRAFPYNSKGQYQTEYLVVNVRPVNSVRLDTFTEGVLISIKESNAPTNFYLSKKDYESALNGAGKCLMARKTGYSGMVWDTGNVPEYTTSSVDTWLNSTYKNKLSFSIRSLIGTTTIWSTTSSFSLTQIDRAIFLLSMEELGLAEDSGNDFTTGEGDELPIASQLISGYLTDGDSTNKDQWTRSKFRRNDEDVGYVWQSRGMWAEPSRSGIGVRPCFTLPGSALVNPTPNADGSYTLIES